MNRKMIRLIILYLTVSACNAQKPLKHDSCVKTFKKFVYGNWTLVEDYYVAKGDFKLAFDSTYVDCIRQLTREDIVDIFGTPTKTSKESISYRYNPCIPSSCSFMVFWFGSSTRLLEIQNMGTTIDHSH